MQFHAVVSIFRRLQLADAPFGIGLSHTESLPLSRTQAVTINDSVFVIVAWKACQVSGCDCCTLTACMFNDQSCSTRAIIDAYSQ